MAPTSPSLKLIGTVSLFIRAYADLCCCRFCLCSCRCCCCFSPFFFHEFFWIFNLFTKVKVVSCFRLFIFASVDTYAVQVSQSATDNKCQWFILSSNWSDFIPAKSNLRLKWVFFLSNFKCLYSTDITSFSAIETYGFGLGNYFRSEFNCLNCN